VAKEPSNLKRKPPGRLVKREVLGSDITVLGDGLRNILMTPSPDGKLKVSFYTGDKRENSIEESKQSKEIASYIKSVLLDGGARNIIFADEVLRDLEKQIPELVLINDIVQLRLAIASSEGCSQPSIQQVQLLLRQVKREIIFTAETDNSVSASAIMDGGRLPENVTVQMPSQAPELWTNDKRSGETPPAFVLRHYEPWLGKGLTRASIRKLDPGLYKAIDNWSRKNAWPEDVDLPTLAEQNNRWIERVSQQEAPIPSLKEARRLESALQRRRTESHKGK